MLTIPPGTRILLVYDPAHGIPTSDGLAAEFVADIVESTADHLIYTSSSLVIDYFRLAVFKTELSPNEIIIRFNDKEILLTKEGRFSDCPVGFCDYMENILMQLI